MQEINSLIGGFAVALTWFNVMLMLAGVTLGDLAMRLAQVTREAEALTAAESGDLDLF